MAMNDDSEIIYRICYVNLFFKFRVLRVENFCSILLTQEKRWFLHFKHHFEIKVLDTLEYNVILLNQVSTLFLGSFNI